MTSIQVTEPRRGKLCGLICIVAFLLVGLELLAGIMVLVAWTARKDLDTALAAAQGQSELPSPPI